MFWAGLPFRIRFLILYPDPYPVLNKKTVVFGNRGFNPGFHPNMMKCKWALLFVNLFDPLRCNKMKVFPRNAVLAGDIFRVYGRPISYFPVGTYVTLFRAPRPSNLTSWICWLSAMSTWWKVTKGNRWAHCCYFTLILYYSELLLLITYVLMNCHLSRRIAAYSVK